MLSWNAVFGVLRTLVPALPSVTSSTLDGDTLYVEWDTLVLSGTGTVAVLLNFVSFVPTCACLGLQGFHCLREQVPRPPLYIFRQWGDIKIVPTATGGSVVTNYKCERRQRFELAVIGHDHLHVEDFPSVEVVHFVSQSTSTGRPPPTCCTVGFQAVFLSKPS